ncbi:MAG TPA: hypothetical protein VJ826_14645 [Candidatus Polarisedimenticolaceae bacterium]|nr:hypothetical protein [Candidatus Polarisedimenticolaceae bacterium]
MNLDGMSAVAVRLFFWLAFGLLGLAILEVTVRQFGYTIARGREPGQLLQYAAILLIFVVAILLRQIRDRVGSRA